MAIIMFTLGGWKGRACVYSRDNTSGGTSSEEGGGSQNSSHSDTLEQLPQNQRVWTSPLTSMTVSSSSGRITGVLSINPHTTNGPVIKNRYNLSDPVLKAKREFFDSQQGGTP